MNNDDFNENQLNILRKINKNSEYTQRKMADDLGISLGKLNYCIKELKKKRINKNKEL